MTSSLFYIFVLQFVSVICLIFLRKEAMNSVAILAGMKNSNQEGVIGWFVPCKHEGTHVELKLSVETYPTVF